MIKPCNCTSGKTCQDCDYPEIARWEYIGAAILVVTLTILSVLIIAGSATWLYGMLGAL